MGHPGSAAPGRRKSGLSDPPSPSGDRSSSVFITLRTNSVEKASFLLCRSQGSIEKILSLLLPPSSRRPPRLATTRPLPRDACKHKPHPVPCTCLHEATLQTLLDTREGAHADPSPVPPPANPSAEPSLALLWKTASLEILPLFPWGLGAASQTCSCRFPATHPPAAAPNFGVLGWTQLTPHAQHCWHPPGRLQPPQLPKRTGCLLIPVLSSLHYQLFPLMCP